MWRFFSFDGSHPDIIPYLCYSTVFLNCSVEIQQHTITLNTYYQIYYIASDKNSKLNML